MKGKKNRSFGSQMEKNGRKNDDEMRGLRRGEQEPVMEEKKSENWKLKRRDRQKVTTGRKRSRSDGNSKLRLK